MEVRDPGAPTSAEVAEHEITHLPHRSWCAACVSGRSRDRQHRRLDGRDQLEVPCVVFDFGFFGGEGDEETLAVQVAKDVGTKMLFAHVVPKRGVMVNHGVTQLMKDIDRLGHKKLCLKSDREPALVAIQEEVRKQRIEETPLENSPVGDSRAVQSVAEQIRVLRAAPAAKLKAKVPGTQPVYMLAHRAQCRFAEQVPERRRRTDSLSLSLWQKLESRDG